MINSATLAKLSEAIYDPKDEFASIIQAGEAYAGVTLIGGQIVVAFRGSANVSDWLHDFDAFPLEVPGIGTVHQGMWEGTKAFYKKLNLAKGDSVAFTGHSLGCAHAAFTARMAIDSGIWVSQIDLFAPPKFGDAVFHAGLDATPIQAWRNKWDIVPELPIGDPWTQFDLTEIDIQPSDDGLNPLAWHSMSLYAKGVAK